MEKSRDPDFSIFPIPPEHIAAQIGDPVRQQLYTNLNELVAEEAPTADETPLAQNVELTLFMYQLENGSGGESLAVATEAMAHPPLDDDGLSTRQLVALLGTCVDAWTAGDDTFWASLAVRFASASGWSERHKAEMLSNEDVDAITAQRRRAAHRYMELTCGETKPVFANVADWNRIDHANVLHLSVHSLRGQEAETAASEWVRVALEVQQVGNPTEDPAFAHQADNTPYNLQQLRAKVHNVTTLPQETRQKLIEQINKAEAAMFAPKKRTGIIGALGRRLLGGQKPADN